MKERDNYIFDFEKLEVYKIGLEFVSKVFKIYQRLPKSFQFTIGEQFIRAVVSITNNIAEGSGKRSKYSKRQFYEYSLNSARECIPMLTILLNEKQILFEEYKSLRSDCIMICKMLGKLIGKIK